MDKNFDFIFGVIQSQEPLEEFRKKWSRLLDEHSDQHIGILLFIVTDRLIGMCPTKQLCYGTLFNTNHCEFGISRQTHFTKFSVSFTFFFFLCGILLHCYKIQLHSSYLCLAQLVQTDWTSVGLCMTVFHLQIAT